MQAEVIPFPTRHGDLQNPTTPTFQIQFLDLAALWLTDNGFDAMAGVYANGRGNTVEGLSTNAPDASVNLAFCQAYSNLCGFLIDEMEYEPGDLPLLADLHPRLTRLARSGYRDGKVFGYV